MFEQVEPLAGGPGAAVLTDRAIRRDARAAAYVECVVAERSLWGVGIDANIVVASLKAVVSAVNRASRDAA